MDFRDLLTRRLRLPALLIWGIGGVVLSYVAIGCLLSIRSVERRAIYTRHFTTPPKRDLDHPERFGFPVGQVTPFRISTPDGVALHVWHVLPVSVYEEHQKALIQGAETRQDIHESLSFHFIWGDPEARLVIHMHGSSGTLASSWRVDSYRELSSIAPNKIHVLTFDYRGFELSEGIPSEKGLITDAEAVLDWAVQVAGIPPERIVIFGHSMGVGVTIGLAERLMSRAIHVAGIVLAAGFVDVATLAKTTRVAGLPIFMPLQSIPGLVEFLTSKLESTWKNGDRLMDVVRVGEKYHIEIIHAQDDSIVPYKHAIDLFQRAHKASGNIALDSETHDIGEPGSGTSLHTNQRRILLALPLEGDHDKILSRPALTNSVLRAFRNSDQ